MDGAKAELIRRVAELLSDDDEQPADALTGTSCWAVGLTSEKRKC